jgi:hypothetical protein
MVFLGAGFLLAIAAYCSLDTQRKIIERQQTATPPAEPPGPDAVEAGREAASSSTLDTGGSEPAGCLDPAPEADEFRHLTQFMEQDASDVARRLAKSSDTEHLLAASFLVRFQDDNSRRRLMNRALELSPTSVVVLRNFLALCTEHSDAAGCVGSAIEQRAIAADGENGSLMVAIAARRAGRGDLPGALEAMTHAATAPQFDSYYSNQILAVDRALSAASELNSPDRLLIAFGYVPSPMEEAAFRLCRDRINDSFEWRHVCLNVAGRMEHDGNTLIVKILGAALQTHVHQLNGNDRQADAADRRRQALRALLSDTAAVFEEKVIRHDPQVVNRYLDTLTSYGEVAAASFIKDEYARIYQAVDDRCRE